MTGWVYAATARIRALFFKTHLDREINDELASHIDMLTDDNMRLGMDPETAHREARIRIGSLDAARELHREARGLPWLESLMQDVRLAVRLALKSPWLSAIALLSLAIGIGANLTAFGIAKAILWQPLPSPVSDRLIAVYNRAQNGAGAYSGLSYPEYEYLRDHNGVLDEFATYVRIYFTVHTSGDSQRVYGELVSSNFFSVLDVRTIQGRSFQPVDDRNSG